MTDKHPCSVARTYQRILRSAIWRRNLGYNRASIGREMSIGPQGRSADYSQGPEASPIDHMRLRMRVPRNDQEIAWALQLHHCRPQLLSCLSLLRAQYPTSRVVLIVDGDDEEYGDIAAAYHCDLVRGVHLMARSTCHLYVNRLLQALLAGNEHYPFKIDPDTRVWRRFSLLPAFSSMFGTLETTTERRRDPISVPPNVQGGCLGITRDPAADILERRVINEQSCVTDYAQTWARCTDMLACAARGRCCDDFILSWAAHAVGLPLVGLEEIRSYCRRTVENDDLRYAVTHPHKQS